MLRRVIDTKTIILNGKEVVIPTERIVPDGILPVQIKVPESAKKQTISVSSKLENSIKKIKPVTPYERVQKKCHKFEQDPSIAVVVSVHENYLKYLYEAIESVEKQNHSFKLEKWLVCDNCDAPNYLPEDWQVIKGNWKSPGPGRNEVIRKTKCTWITFLDADDKYEDNFLNDYYKAASEVEFNVAFIYPNFYYCDENMEKKNIRQFSEWDYHKLRQFNFIPTPSLWRIDALRSIGWEENTPVLDDWNSSIKLSRMGWIGKHIGSYIFIRKHSANTSKNHDISYEKIFNTKSLSIVTLLSGRKDQLDRWEDWIRQAKLPKETTIFAADNSYNEDFADDILSSLKRIASNGYSIFYKKVINPIKDEEGPRCAYSRVPTLYNQILTQACNSDMILFLEDDVHPPLNAVKTLFDCFDLSGKKKIGAVAGIYPCRNGNGTRVSLSSRTDIWTGNINIDNIQKGMNPAGMVPGGCTLYSQEALMDTIPFRFSFDKSGNPTGWDGNMNRCLRDKGWEIYYHGDVKCEHHTKDRNSNTVKVLKFPEIKKGCGSPDTDIMREVVLELKDKLHTEEAKELYKKHYKSVESNPLLSSCTKKTKRKEFLEKLEKMMKISLVIPAREEPEEELRNTISSFRKAGADEIIVIDDNSKVPVKQDCGADIVINNKEAIGVSSSRNLGLSKATGDVICFSDSHCKVYSGSFRHWAFEAFATNRLMCAVTSSYDVPDRYYYGYELCWDKWYFKGAANTIMNQYPGGVYGSVYCAHKETWNKIGGWMPTKQWGANEQALSLACILANIDVFIDPDFRILHKFRNDKKFPYPVEASISKANHPWIYWIIFGEELYRKFFEPAARKNLSSTCLDNVNEWIKTEGEFYRNKYEALRKNSPEQICEKIKLKLT